MYKKFINTPTIPPELTDEKKKEIFSIGNLKKLISKLNEKKENEIMKNEKDLLVDSLIQKQISILNKIQLVDEKAAAYRLSEQGEVIQQFIESLDVAEKQIDDSLESFDKTEDSIVRAWNRIRENTIEAWSKIQDDCSELEELDEETVEEYENEDNETKIVVYDMFDDWSSKEVSGAVTEGYVSAKIGSDINKAIEKAKQAKLEELANKETVHVKFDIEKHGQYANEFYSSEYLISYVITEQNGVKRAGEQVIDPDDYETGVLTDFAVELIEKYGEALLKGDVISYTGEFTV